MGMRTTLDLDDDILAALRAISESQAKSMSKLASLLIRSALTEFRSGLKDSQSTEDKSERNGIPLLPIRGRQRIITPEIVNRNRDND